MHHRAQSAPRASRSFGVMIVVAMVPSSTAIALPNFAEYTFGSVVTEQRPGRICSSGAVDGSMLRQQMAPYPGEQECGGEFASALNAIANTKQPIPPSPRRQVYPASPRFCDCHAQGNAQRQGTNVATARLAKPGVRQTSRKGSDRFGVAMPLRVGANMPPLPSRAMTTTAPTLSTKRLGSPPGLTLPSPNPRWDA